MKKFLLLLLLGLLVFQGIHYRERISLWFAVVSPKPSWVKAQLAEDFREFSSITQGALEETFEKLRGNQVFAYRYRLLDGKIYRIGPDDSSGRTFQFEKILRRLARSKKLPPVDFLICMSDGVPEFYHPKDFWITKNQAPLFAWAKRKHLAPYVVLIPDFLTTKEASWHKEIEIINKKYREIPWENREEKAFWRGASNDKGYTLENYTEKPRFLISALTLKAPDLVDASFCRVYPSEVEVAVAKLGLIVKNTPIAGHLPYKYLPVLDGYMCTFPGFQWRLLSGSLTLKQQSDEVQYFYSALEPYKHYLPINQDMSDLLEKLSWAKSHDAECKQIAENARKFALSNLMPNQIYAYLYWVLQRWASLQTFDLKELPLGPEWEERVR